MTGLGHGLLSQVGKSQLIVAIDATVEAPKQYIKCYHANVSLAASTK